MRIVAHLSDLHFGTEIPVVVEALVRDLDGHNAPLPSLVAISGDLTQRARTKEFKACRAFLDRLRVPFVVVPGNHDLPLYNVMTRFTDPLARYRRWIDRSEMPTFADGELAVVGLNTPRAFKAKGGLVTRAQIERGSSYFAERSEPWRVLVAHHPFMLPVDAPQDDLIEGAAIALPLLERCAVDVILTGHLHVASSSSPGFRNEHHTIVSVHAGTCISSRLRGEPNGYNRLVLEDNELTILHRVWNGAGFVDGASKKYRRRQDRHLIDLVDERPPAAPSS